jgi:hypothetical protein
LPRLAAPYWVPVAVSILASDKSRTALGDLVTPLNGIEIATISIVPMHRPMKVISALSDIGKSYLLSSVISFG